MTWSQLPTWVHYGAWGLLALLVLAIALWAWLVYRRYRGVAEIIAGVLAPHVDRGRNADAQKNDDMEHRDYVRRHLTVIKDKGEDSYRVFFSTRFVRLRDVPSGQVLESIFGDVYDLDAHHTLRVTVAYPYSLPLSLWLGYCICCVVEEVD